MVSNCPLLGPVADRVPDCISVIKGEIFWGEGGGRWYGLWLGIVWFAYQRHDGRQFVSSWTWLTMVGVSLPILKFQNARAPRIEKVRNYS